MTQYQPPPAPPYEPPVASWPASTQVNVPLMRREQSKVVSGVCAGVGYRLGIDPNIVRVVIVVLAIFGGGGVLLYAVGWLLMPDERTGTSLGERAIRGGGPNGLSVVLLALVLAVVAVGLGVAILSDSGFSLVVLLVALTVGAVLLSRRPVAAGSAGYAPATQSMPYPSAQAMYPQSPLAPTVAPERPPQRPQSVLGPLTCFAALAAVGILGVVDAAGASVPFSAYLATALAVVGLGLLTGAWLGRSRGLIALGAVLAVVLVPVTTVEQLDLADLAGDRNSSVLFEPATAAEIDGVTFEHTAGDVRYDLTDLRLGDRTVQTTIRLGAGNLVVVVPDDVTLRVTAEAAAGQIDLLGETSEGLALTLQTTGAGEPGAGTLRLDVGVGLGNVEVDRAGA